MHIPWSDLEIFLAVADSSSFSGASRQLGVTQPTVSRRIQVLEERLDRALFRRDVDGAHLTEEGAKLLPAATQMSRFAKELSNIASDFDERPAGIVRIAMPPGTAHNFLVPFARVLRKTYPDIKLHAIAGIDHLDLSRGHAELAIRNKKPTQPDLMVLGHAKVGLGVFAASKYLKKKRAEHKGPLKAKDLDWISWAYPNEHMEPNPTLERRIPSFQPVFASNDFNVQARAVSEGLGVMVLPQLYHINQPGARLEEVDVGIRFPATDVYFVCAKTMRWVPRVRYVVAELMKSIGTLEGLSFEVNED